MSIKRNHQPGELDKRLKVLNQQLYGKKSDQPTKIHSSSISDLVETTKHTEPTRNSDITYLKHDLTKITILAALAFGAQFALYYSMINHYIKLSF